MAIERRRFNLGIRGTITFEIHCGILRAARQSEQEQSRYKADVLTWWVDSQAQKDQWAKEAIEACPPL